jgi:hypothetical protein
MWTVFRMYNVKYLKTPLIIKITMNETKTTVNLKYHDIFIYLPN